MEVTLGRTGIVTNKNAFGALPIQRVSTEYAGKLLRKAYDAGITYFDTAYRYHQGESENFCGIALSKYTRSFPYTFLESIGNNERISETAVIS